MRISTLTIIALAALAGSLLAGCSSSPPNGGSSTVGTTPAAGVTSSGATTAPKQANPYQPPSSSTQLAGSGSTFVGPLVESWAIQYNREESKVQVSYAKKGSGAGRTDLFNKDVFFAGSDAPLTPQQKTDNPGILQFPEALGAIAMAYNIPGVSSLKLDGETIGKIYTGAITKWNDPAITAQNPGVDLPSATIAPFRRSDSSGTTFAWSDFVSKTSESWRAKFGSAPNTAFDWTRSAANPQGAAGNDGVSDQVSKTPDSIGYVELAYIFAKNLKAADIKSHDGAYLQPTVDGASAAAANSASLPAVDGDWSQVSIVNAAGATSYPISTYSYMMVYKALASYGSKATANQQAAFKAWMWWCLHDGQQYALALGYAPLPPGVVAIGEHALAMMN